MALRALGQLGFWAIILGYAWGAINGNGLAALVFGFGCVAIAYALKRDDARRS